MKAMGIVIVLGIGSQAIGYNIVIPNLQSIFEMANTNVSSEFSSLTSGCFQLFGAFCAVLVTDRFGRKPLFSISLIGVAIGMVSQYDKV